MKIGYVRVSTSGQETARQETIMKELGVEKVFIDKMSGKNTNRPQLREMLEFVRDGDILVVESYSRLSRSLSDLLMITSQLKNKGVGFISKKENFDTTSPSGKLMLGVFASLAEYEREVMLQRQQEGLREAVKKGVKFGRKPIRVEPDKFQSVVVEWRAGKMTAVQAMAELGLKPNTFYRRVKELKSEK